MHSRLMIKLVASGFAVVSIQKLQNDPSDELHVDGEIGALSSPQSLSSDPGKSHAAKVTVGLLPIRPFNPGEFTVPEVPDKYVHKYAGIWPFNPGEFSVPEDPDKYAGKYSGKYAGKYADKYEYVQSHDRGSDTGMNGAGGGKGKDGEPTKDDERTLAWKLRLSVKAVTPMFMASAKISFEKKSG